MALLWQVGLSKGAIAGLYRAEKCADNTTGAYNVSSSSTIAETALNTPGDVAPSCLCNNIYR